MQDEWVRAIAGESGMLGGRYVLGRSLGRGSFGQVFLADDVKFRPPRPVALKLLHPQFISDPVVREEIAVEAGVLARFTHPYILRVLDFEVNPQLAYIVTEVADGGSLAQRLRPDPAQPPVPMPLPLVALYLEQIASALDEAHNLGLVHRDIKPQNILLDKTGRPMLADFGLAAALGSTSSSILVETSSSGTPLYMAPEQWAGQVGKTTDIYALGIVIYQLITGQPPFQGNQSSLAWQHTTAQVPRLADRAPGLSYPPALDGLLAHVLAKDPRQRLRPAGDFARHFRAILNGPGVSGSLNASPEAATTLLASPGISSATTLEAFNSPPADAPLPTSTLTPTGPGPASPLRGTFFQAPSASSDQASIPPSPVRPDAPAPISAVTVLPTKARRHPLSQPFVWIPGVGLLLIGLAAVIALLVANNGKTTVVSTSTSTSTSITTPSLAQTVVNSTASSTTSPLAQSAGTQASSTAVSCASNPLPTFPPAPTLAADGTGLLSLEVLESDCKLARGPNVYVRVFRQGDRNASVAQAGGEARLFIPLPPGIYEVEVTYSSDFKQTGPAVEIKSGQTSLQSINLRVGQVNLEVTESSNKTARGSNVYVKVYKQGDRNTVITQTGGENKLNFVLRPGMYEFEVSYADSLKVVGPPLEVKEAQTVSQKINLAAGQINLEVLETVGKAARGSNVYVKVYKQGDRDNVITQGGGESKYSFILPVGVYEFEVSYANDLKQDGPGPVEVKEGQTASQTLNLHVGQLALEIVQTDGKTARPADIYVRIYRQGDQNTIIAQGGGEAKLNFVLRPGLYEVEVTYTGDVKVAGPPVEIKEGQAVTQMIKVGS